MTYDPRQVIAYRAAACKYPTSAPFHPHVNYPEYPFGEITEIHNYAYEAVRNCFVLAGLDATHLGTPSWNPLGDLIHPGECVLLKPNLVKEWHPRDPDGWQYILTHGSIIRAVSDYVWIALQRRGAIIVADAPQTDSCFTTLRSTLGLAGLEAFYMASGVDFQVVDLRKEEWTVKDKVVTRRAVLRGDPAGYCAFDLAASSEFEGFCGEGFYYGADYDEGEVNRHHSAGRHEYLIAGSAVQADVVFSLPKLKTHKKVGITVSLKNLVGINGDKNWLPHHTESGPNWAGDERPDLGLRRTLERRTVRALRHLSLALPGIGPWVHRHGRRLGTQVFGDTDEIIRSGNWYGNDTCWRMCLDLNKCLSYGKPDGTFYSAAANRKRHLVLVDGIIAGEGRGPMDPDPVNAGIILFGTNPPSVDAACAILMGFDPECLPIVRQAFRCKELPLAEWDWRDVLLSSNDVRWRGALPEIEPESTLHFRPHFGWIGAIERIGSRVDATAAAASCAKDELRRELT